MKPSGKRIAIVYDWIDKWGGVERLLLELHRLLPETPIYTSYYDPVQAQWASSMDIRTSFLQQLPAFIKRSRVVSFLLYPYAFESFDFSEFDIVISVSSSFAKGVITKPGTKHISIILTPTRYLWALPHHYKKAGIIGWVQEIIAVTMRKWDYIAAQRADLVYVISELVQERTTNYYKRDSRLLYPPFPQMHWSSVRSKMTKPTVVLPETFYLIVSRLEPYKAVDIAIEAFSELEGENLVIIGAGSLRKKLEQRSGANTYLFSGCSDNELAWLYTHAKALLMPQEEDFGYVGFEAFFFCCPILTYKKNYISRIVYNEGVGVVFNDQTSDSLHQALATFSSVAYNVRENLSNKRNRIIDTINDERFDTEIKSLCS